MPIHSGLRSPDRHAARINGLALQVQETLGRDPHSGELYVFRGRRGDLIKILWHDGLGMSLYAKRLERGQFIWASPTNGIAAFSGRAADLSAGRDRLGQSASQLPSRAGGMSRQDRYFL